MAPNTLLYTNRDEIIAKSGKTREEVDKDIDTIIEWFKEQKHLPEILNRIAIERYLVFTKFSIERTKQLCDMYYTCRKLVPKVFENSNPMLPENSIYFDVVIHLPLPKLTKDLYRVFILKFTDFEISDYNPNKLITHVMNIFEILQFEELSLGHVLVVDMEKVRLSYALSCTPVHLKTSDFFMQNIWTTPIKGIHFVNVPPFAEFIINLLKNIMKKKILGRTFLHKSAESLYEHIEKKVLPADYGGEEISTTELNEMWRKKVTSHQDMYNKLDKLEVNEALRPAPLENSDVLGYYGNFKTLNVD